jgi:hypothetical protein
VRMTLLQDAFRVNFVPKAYKHFDEILEKVDTCLYAHVARDIRSKSLFKRVFFIIPFRQISSQMYRAVRILRSFRLTYVLSYWTLDSLNTLFWSVKKHGESQDFLDDIALILRFKKRFPSTSSVRRHK